MLKGRGFFDSSGLDTLTLLLFLAIVAGGIAAAFCVFSGLDPYYDDTFYVFYAYQLLSGNLTFMVNAFSYSFLNLAPIAVSFALFGYNTYSAILPSVVEYALLMFIAMMVARRLYGRTFAAIGTVLVATAPFLTMYITRALPDINIGLAVALSISLFLLSVRRGTRILAVASGVAAAYTIYVKNVAFLYLALFIIANLIAYRGAFLTHKYKSGRGHVKASKARYALLGNLGITFLCIAIGLFLYMLVFYLSAGNPLFPFINYGTSPAVLPPLQEVYLLVKPYYSYSGLGLNSNFELFSLGPIAILAVIGTAIGIYRKNSNINYLSFFNWAIFAYLIFGTSTIHGYVPVPTVSRFFAIIAMPLAVLGGYAMYHMYRAAKAVLRNKTLVMAAFVLLIVAMELSYIPVYKMFTYYASWIYGSRNEFVSAAAYIGNATRGQNVSVYVNAPEDGLLLDGLYYTNFSVSFSKSFRLYSVASVAYYSNSTVVVDGSRACNDTVGNNAYLLDIGSTESPYATSHERGNMYGWLGNNCTAEQVSSFLGSDTTPFKIFLYKINYIA